jgi:hypothetical protein
MLMCASVLHINAHRRAQRARDVIAGGGWDRTRCAVKSLVSAAKWYIFPLRHIISVPVIQTAGAGVCGLEARYETTTFFATAFQFTDAPLSVLLSSNLDDGCINVWNMQASCRHQIDTIYLL